VTREADAESLNRKVLGSAPQEKSRTVPPTGDGQKIFQIDPMLNGYKYHLEYQYALLASFHCTLQVVRIFHKMLLMAPTPQKCHDAFEFYLNSCICSSYSLRWFSGGSYVT
jgi:hypothetical protein